MFHRSAYSQIFLKSLFSTFADSKGSQISENKEVLSANSLTLLFKLFGRSLMYIMESNGPKIKPCGTSAWIVSQSDVWPLGKTLWNLPLKKLVINWNIFPPTPFCFNLNNNTSCQTLSNALICQGTHRESLLLACSQKLKRCHERLQVVNKCMKHQGENPTDV